MGITVDKTAQVDANAELGDGCTIGAYCTVGPYVTIGENTKLVSHVVVDGYTTIGSDCKIYPFTTIGLQSQDLKYVEGHVTYCVIGDHNIIREHVSVHAATEEHTTTRIGSNCALLAQSHVGHNCTVGDYVILSHASALGGHVFVGDRANIGGLGGCPPILQRWGIFNGGWDVLCTQGRATFRNRKRQSSDDPRSK